MENGIKNYLKHFGKKLITKEIEEYATEVALKHSRYMFIERRGKERYSYDPLTEGRKRIGKQQYGYCTYCNKEYETEGLKHNKETVCPGCGSKVRVRASGISRKYLWDDAYFVHYEKSKIDKDVIVAKGIFVERVYNGDYKNIKNYYSVKALYIFEIKKPIMLTDDTWWERDKDRWRIRQRIYSLENTFGGRVYKSVNLDSIEKAIVDTPYQYSMYKEYNSNYEDSLKYFELFSKYPRIEDLTKLGFKSVVKAKLYNRQTYSAINWNGKTVFKMLKINAAELKDLINSKRHISTCFLKLYQINKKEKSKLDIEQLKDLEYCIESNYEKFKELNKLVTLRKIYKYKRKQDDVQKNQNRENRYYSFISTWIDYIEDCKKLDLDISEESTLFPKNLQVAHQKTIAQIKYKKNELIDKGIKMVAEKANNKYKFEDGKFIIRAIESTQELITEGEKLHHCVGGYAYSYATGETTIFTIRRKRDINKPYYTMEIKKDRIVQVRGKNNKAPDKALENFINKFKYEKFTSSKNKLNQKLA